MNEWFGQLDTNSLALGVLAGLLVAVLAAWLAWRRGCASATEQLQPLVADLRQQVDSLQELLAGTQRERDVTQARLEEQQQHFARERAGLEQGEKRLTESFERLAARVFEERSRSFNEVSEKQMKGLLSPLTRDLEQFRKQVDETHRAEIAQHAALRERLQQLESLNESLNQEAKNLTRALTRDVKAQGGWGEQQLERLLELAGLRKGETFHTQYSVLNRDGDRLQPDLVLSLPEGKSIVMDSKVSLTAWTRLQAADTDEEGAGFLAEHVRSIKAHIDSLSAKNYAGVEELNALDFVLMFVPIESALIAALQQDPTLPEYALKKRVALLSPANFLATVRTVASVWTVHKQNSNARDIADRAGLLYDKFRGFVTNLGQVGTRLEQAKRSYDSAFSQLSTGPGNLVVQVEKLRVLGAVSKTRLDEKLLERAAQDEADSEIVDAESEPAEVSPTEADKPE